MPGSASNSSEVSLEPKRSRLAWRTVVPLLLICAGLAVYHNSFQGGFIFDDDNAIVGNPHVRTLWPIWEAMSAPRVSSVAGRPIVCLSFAINYACGGTNVWGYHVANVAIHILAALLLFGIARRTLTLERFRDRFGNDAPWLALAVAMIWLVHPLLTESVDYITQRTESLMGMFFFLTLYCAIRAIDSRRRAVWGVAAVLACALGMGCKETMAVAPLMVLLYDHLFLSSSVEKTLQGRKALYAALFAAWILLAFFIAFGQGRTRAEGYGLAHLSSWDYLKTQCGVILHYLRLSFWPHPLVVDYEDWPIAKSMLAVLPSASVIVALLAGTIWALWRRSWLGFLGAWFFLTLAPTSSFIPIATEVAAERRMYLPLAAVVAVVVIVCHRVAAPWNHRWMPRAEIALAAGLVTVLGCVTIRRNPDYRGQVRLMETVIAARPDNARAHYNLAIATGGEDPAKGIAHYSEALRVAPDYVDAHNNLAVLLAQQGRFDEAISHFRTALRLKPDLYQAHNSLGAALAQQGKLEEAIAEFTEALKLKPDSAEAKQNLETALASRNNGLRGTENSGRQN